MKFINKLLIILVLFTGISTYAQEIEEYKLKNGLTVYLNQDLNAPEVFGMVTVKVGSKNDPATNTGLAHYQEHMLFKGSTKLGTTNWEKEKAHIDKIFKLYDKLAKTSGEEAKKQIQKQINEESLKAGKFAIPNEFSNILKSMGSKNINAGTGTDQTVYYNSFPSNQLEKWLILNTDRFMNPVFRGFQSELEVVYEEKNMYTDQFFSNLLEKFQKNFFKKHPYGQQTILGSVEHLKNPSLNAMYDFFKTYYVANNMALILTGNFKPEIAKPLIEKTFGQLESGNVPEPKVWKEEPFKGRVLIEDRLSPLKLGIIGFRTVPKGHPDQIALTIANNILSNQNHSGLLDKLMLNNEIMGAMVLPMPYIDHGASIILYIPKVVGQKLTTAEEIVMNKMKMLRNGEFEDWKIDAAKKNLYLEYQLSLEDLEDKASIISNIFIRGANLNEIYDYPQKIKAITKADIIRVAKKYYGDDYLVLHSKMGLSKPEKLSKPEYEPVIAKNNVKSNFVKELESLPIIETTPDYIDINKDITTKELKKNLLLYHVKNPNNDIFTLKIRFGTGKIENPLIEYAAQIMNFSGTEKFKVNELKEEFSKIGCTYSISANDNYTTIELEGIEESLEEALKLIDQLIAKPVLEKSKLKNITEGVKATRKLERADADGVARALFEYVKYSKKSSFLDRLTLKEVKKLKTDQLIEAFDKATKYKTEIHYVGNTQTNKVADLINNNLHFNSELAESKSPQDLELNKYNENIIYLVNKKKAIQSKVFFFANQDVYKPEQQAYIDAFKMYFGGGFSGLVLQEIREYRSLAYTAGAFVSTPKQMNHPCCFVGYVGTQADKTLTAIETFNDLVRNMPEKTDRMPMIKNFLLQSSIIDKPNYRNLSTTVLSWKNKGFNDDPTKLKTKTYENLTFSDIVKFYKKNLKNKPMAIAIVGDKKQINLDELKKYGKIVEIKEKSLFR